MRKGFCEELTRTAEKENIQRYVVGAIIIKNSKVLLLKRPSDDFLGGIYELPSGKVEEGETLLDALHREVNEETGLKIGKIKEYAGSFDYASKSGKKTRQFNFIVTVNFPVNIVLQEHDDFAWASNEQLTKYAVTDSVKKILNLCFK